MISEAPGWIKLPSGVYVSSDSIQNGDGFLSLKAAEQMDVTTFNKAAVQYGVHMDENDAPIDRLVKYSVFLARRDGDVSSVHTNRQYVDMLLEVAANRCGEPTASFYNALKTSHADVTRDVLEFHGKVSEGVNKGKYEVTLLRFDDNGNLQPIDEILVAHEGWTVSLGTKHRFPIETQKEFCRVQNIEVVGIDDAGASGYWYIGNEPTKGEQRIDIRGPSWDGGKLLGASVHRNKYYSYVRVGALRSRKP